MNLKTVLQKTVLRYLEDNPQGRGKYLQNTNATKDLYLEDTSTHSLLCIAGPQKWPCKLKPHNAILNLNQWEKL